MLLCLFCVQSPYLSLPILPAEFLLFSAYFTSRAPILLCLLNGHSTYDAMPIGPAGGYSTGGVPLSQC